MTTPGLTSTRNSIQVPKPLVRLPITPPGKNHIVSHAASSLSRSAISRGVNINASLQVPAEHGGSQCPVTMQTRVAIRDTTPHRFQTVPLREVKGSNNISELHVVGTKGLKCRNQGFQSINWQPSPIPSSFASRSCSNVSTVVLRRSLEANIHIQALSTSLHWSRPWSE